MSASTDIDRKLQELLDKQEINEVLVRYCRGFDRGDADLLNMAYHPGAIDDRFPVDAQGNPQTVPDIGKHLAERSTRGGANRVAGVHRLSTVSISLEGDVAYAESYWDVTMVRRDGAEAVVARSDGRYVDRLERRNGRWGIVRRRLIYEWTSSERVPLRERQGIPSLQSREDISYERLERVGDT